MARGAPAPATQTRATQATDEPATSSGPPLSHRPPSQPPGEGGGSPIPDSSHPRVTALRRNGSPAPRRRSSSVAPWTAEHNTYRLPGRRPHRQGRRPHPASCPARKQQHGPTDRPPWPQRPAGEVSTRPGPAGSPFTGRGRPNGRQPGSQTPPRSEGASEAGLWPKRPGAMTAPARRKQP